MRSKKTISRRAQVQMMETVMVLMIFFIIVVIGFMFYSRIQESSIRQLQRERFEDEAVAISQNVIFFPELACSEKSVLIDICFDIYKLEGFAEMVDVSDPANNKNFLYYQKDFGSSVITVREIFPPDRTGDWVLYDNPPINFQETSSVKILVPVSLKDPTKRYGQYSIGLLEIEVYA